MRTILFCLAVVPCAVRAQSLPSRTLGDRTSVPMVQPSTTAEGVATLDANAPRVDDMPAPVVQLSDPGPTSVKLSWNAIVGASGYVVYRNDVGAVNVPPLPLTTTSYTHRAPNDYRLTYTYRVVAQYPNGHTGPSAPVTFTPPKAPAVTAFEAAFQGNDVVFTWSSPVDPDYFMLFGPGLDQGQRVPGNTYTYRLDATRLVDQNLRGLLEYMASAVFEPGPVTAPAAEWQKTDVFFHRGRYRFSIVGFTAEEATRDAPDRYDGKGDEIFVAAAVHRYEKSIGSLATTTVARTRVYGEVGPFPGRISGGTLPGGGIQSKDQVWANAAPAGVPPDSALPLTVWEGELYEDDALVIRPAVFESDREDGDTSNCYNLWRRLLSTRASGSDPTKLDWQLTHELSNPRIAKDLGYLEAGGVVLLDGFIGCTSRSNQTIGLDRVITFDIPKIERFFQYNVGTQFSFKSGREDGGIYLVRMKIERVTDPPPVRKLRR